MKIFHENDIKKKNKLHHNYDNMLSNLELFNKVMNEANIFYWVGEGTALGFIRENKIIEYDTDVDVGMYYENKEKFLVFVLPKLLYLGFRIMRIYPFSIVKNGEYIDIDFIGLDKPAMTYSWPDVANPWINKLEPFQKVNVNNIEYNIPSIQYIQYLYGDDWNIPKIGFKPNHLQR